MREEKKLKVKKGWLAVIVGLEDGEGDGFQRFEIPISYLYHPLFKRLLDKKEETYGYRTPGPLSLPCSADDFLRLCGRIEREAGHHRRPELWELDEESISVMAGKALLNACLITKQMNRIFAS
ncbi:hypothetical protein ACLOJK_016573 [Asimina triloba]